MKQLLFATDHSWAGLILRLTAGFIMLPHGLQKMFGLFGGHGFKPTVDYFTNVMKLPRILAAGIIIIEVICSVGLIAGMSSRICALLFMAIMLGAIITTNFQNGLFMNWYGSQKGEGYEYHLLMIGICLAILFTGSGKYSADSLIAGNL